MYFAPVQGHTDAAYRHFHSASYAVPEIIYTTPFIRLEKGEIRKKDLKDSFNPLNEGLNLIPQIIFKNADELRRLTEILVSEGAGAIDINMGCPFPLQVSRGRGAATIGNPECAGAVEKVVREYSDIRFSVKMRLGIDTEEWTPLIETLNGLPLDHLTVHPRTSRSQYMPGTLDMEAFDRIYEGSTSPIVYNGDIRTPGEALSIINRYPALHGIMIGRGALGRPSIFSEIMDGSEWDKTRRLEAMREFHRNLFSHYRDNLIGGDHQVLSKILPFWEYAEEEIGRKAWKAIRKSSGMAKYQTALTLINV